MYDSTNLSGVSLIDDETRFWIAKEVANSKEIHDASGLFRQAKEIIGTKPKVIIIDGLRSYHEAYMKEFWEWADRKELYTPNTFDYKAT